MADQEINIEIDDNALNVDLKEEVFNISIDGAVGGDFATKIHNHPISDINGLQQYLNILAQGANLRIGGYFTNS
jgi:hypothetical protein